jgi:hypothetical protein
MKRRPAFSLLDTTSPYFRNCKWNTKDQGFHHVPIENAIVAENIHGDCLENTQSASRARGPGANSGAVLNEEPHVEERGPAGGDQHRLAETEFSHEL